MLRYFVLSIALIAVVGCAGRPPVIEDSVATKVEKDRFAQKVLTLIGTRETLCDSTAIADKSIYWTCGPYSDGHVEFIKDWERVSESVEIKDEFKVSRTSDWMIFNDRSGVDFYARAYLVSGARVLIAYDPSETGREIFIGNGAPILDIMSASTSRLNTSFLRGSTTPEVLREELPLVGGTSNATQADVKSASTSSLVGSKNCSDFDNQRDAIAYFRENGFGVGNDPYGLDGDNNGIPCESFARQSRSTPSASSGASSGSKCPPGKSWVGAYTRKDGRNVRGHCRKRR